MLRDRLTTCLYNVAESIHSEIHCLTSILTHFLVLQPKMHNYLVAIISYVYRIWDGKDVNAKSYARHSNTFC